MVAKQSSQKRISMESALAFVPLEDVVEDLTEANPEDDASDLTLASGDLNWESWNFGITWTVQAIRDPKHKWGFKVFVSGLPSSKGWKGTKDLVFIAKHTQNADIGSEKCRYNDENDN